MRHIFQWFFTSLIDLNHITKRFYPFTLSIITFQQMGNRGDNKKKGVVVAHSTIDSYLRHFKQQGTVVIMRRSWPSTQQA